MLIVSLTVLWIATILIFIRSIYRVVELQNGFNGTIANNEVAFMILEGPMIILASLLLTVFHPGYVFKENWQAAAWSLRGKKPNMDSYVTDEDVSKMNA